MYKTGDMARYMAGGLVECLGRNDFQVKIRGFRIELGEIELELERHPEIRNAVVVAQKESEGDLRLVAYFIAKNPETGEQLASQLRRDLGTRLPAYMIPAFF